MWAIYLLVNSVIQLTRPSKVTSAQLFDVGLDSVLETLQDVSIDVNIPTKLYIWEDETPNSIWEITNKATFNVAQNVRMSLNITD